ncbi:MAG TPA: branched-chain amino acid ABC transporter permease [Micromonosporaceae bacterium]
MTDTPGTEELGAGALAADAGTTPPAVRRAPVLSGRLAGQSWLRPVLLVVGLVVVWGLPRWLYPPVAIDILCWALLAVSVDLLLGYVGLLSFGHAAFWGSSAYVTGLVAAKLGAPFPVAVLAGALVAALIAAPIGYLAVRRTGIYFAMVTLAFAQMLYFVANEWRSVTGGENGLQDVPRTLFGVDLSDPYYFYYWMLPLALLGFGIAWRVVHSPFGRVLVAIRDNASRVRALGYPAHLYKIAAFVLSAFLAGLGGGIFAEAHGFVSLDVLHWTTSGKAVVLVVLGGIGTLWGGTLGAAIVVRLEDWLSLQHFEQVSLVTGALFVVVVLLFRRGIWGTAAHLARRWRR